MYTRIWAFLLVYMLNNLVYMLNNKTLDWYFIKQERYDITNSVIIYYIDK